MNPISKERRQIEILTLALSSKQGIPIGDLCEIFGKEVATIRRDISELQANSIALCSRKNMICLVEPIRPSKWNTIIAMYLALVGDTIGHPKNISYLVKKLKNNGLIFLSTIVNAIEKRQILEIRYKKVYTQTDVSRIVEPYQIIPTQRDWRLIAKSDGKFKQFLIENILSITDTRAKFIRDKQYNLQNYFENSFFLWQGSERIEVEIQFSEKVAQMISNGIWTDDQEIVRNEDGSINFTTTVNIMEEIAGWVMSWGEDAKIVRPQSLREYILKKAEAVISANR